MNVTNGELIKTIVQNQLYFSTFNLNKRMQVRQLCIICIGAGHTPFSLKHSEEKKSNPSADIQSK